MGKILLYFNKIWDLLVDKKLGINTGKLMMCKEHNNITNFMYEPYPYVRLYNIFKVCPIKKEDYFIDIGCGKGRVLAVVVQLGGENVYGIDISKELVEMAEKNMERCKYNSAAINCKIQCIDARKYKFDNRINKIFFNSPFQLKVFIYVIKSILCSVNEKRREITVYFTEAKPSVIQYFETHTNPQCLYKNEKSREYIYVLK